MASTASLRGAVPSNSATARSGASVAWSVGGEDERALLCLALRELSSLAVDSKQQGFANRNVLADGFATRFGALSRALTLLGDGISDALRQAVDAQRDSNDGQNQLLRLLLSQIRAAAPDCGEVPAPLRSSSGGALTSARSSSSRGGGASTARESAASRTSQRVSARAEGAKSSNDMRREQLEAELQRTTKELSVLREAHAKLASECASCPGGDGGGGSGRSSSSSSGGGGGASQSGLASRPSKAVLPWVLHTEEMSTEECAVRSVCTWGLNASIMPNALALSGGKAQVRLTLADGAPIVEWRVIFNKDDGKHAVVIRGETTSSPLAEAEVKLHFDDSIASDELTQGVENGTQIIKVSTNGWKAGPRPVTLQAITGGDGSAGARTHQAVMAVVFTDATGSTQDSEPEGSDAEGTYSEDTYSEGEEAEVVSPAVPARAPASQPRMSADASRTSSASQTAASRASASQTAASRASASQSAASRASASQSATSRASVPQPVASAPAGDMSGASEDEEPESDPDAQMGEEEETDEGEQQAPPEAEEGEEPQQGAAEVPQGPRVLRSQLMDTSSSSSSQTAAPPSQPPKQGDSSEVQWVVPSGERAIVPVVSDDGQQASVAVQVPRIGSGVTLRQLWLEIIKGAGVCALETAKDDSPVTKIDLLHIATIADDPQLAAGTIVRIAMQLKDDVRLARVDSSPDISMGVPPGLKELALDVLLCRGKSATTVPGVADLRAVSFVLRGVAKSDTPGAETYEWQRVFSTAAAE